MLTIFSTPKPFRGHAGIIQRNAIKSWTLLDPDYEIILFGDEAGTAEVAAEFGIRHEPEVRRSEYGTKRLDYMFSRAQEIGRHDLFCYANCDLVFLQSFRQAVKSTATWRRQFLMVGQRRNTPVTEPLDFDKAEWEAQLRDFSLRSGELTWRAAVEYFVCPRGLYRDMPPFVVGRVCWDPWIVWKAHLMGLPVVDATPTAFVVHQNHDHGYHPRGVEGVQTDVESERNRRLAGGQRHLYNIEHAAFRVSNGRVEVNPGHWLVPTTYLVRAYCSNLWHGLMRMTLRPRHALGLDKEGLSGLKTRLRSMIGQ
jgi:hypothetical protein